MEPFKEEQVKKQILPVHFIVIRYSNAMLASRVCICFFLYQTESKQDYFEFISYTITFLRSDFITLKGSPCLCQDYPCIPLYLCIR